MPAPLINGVNYSWANVTLVLFGVPVVGIVSIEYNRKQAKENNYGAGHEPISRGRGNVSYEGSIELYTEEWRAIIAAAPNKDPLRVAPFDIPVTFGGDGVDFTSDTLKFVEFMEDPLSTKQGDTSIKVKIPLIIGSIQHN